MFNKFHTGYVMKPLAPPPPPIKVWGKNRGQPAAKFEVGNTSSVAAAIKEVQAAGYTRALALVCG